MRRSGRYSTQKPQPLHQFGLIVTLPYAFLSLPKDIAIPLEKPPLRQNRAGRIIVEIELQHVLVAAEGDRHELREIDDGNTLEIGIQRRVISWRWSRLKAQSGQLTATMSAPCSRASVRIR